MRYRLNHNRKFAIHFAYTYKTIITLKSHREKYLAQSVGIRLDHFLDAF